MLGGYEMILKKCSKLFTYLFLCFVFGMFSVSASETLGNYEFNETSSKTDYVKIAFSDGNTILVEFYSDQNPDLVKKMKSVMKSFQNGTVTLNNGIVFTVNNEKDKTYEMDKSSYRTPFFGDLVAGQVDYEGGVVSLSQIQFFLTSSNDSFPVFGHVIYNQEVLSSISTGTTIEDIHFIKMVKKSNSESDKSDKSDKVGSTIESAGTTYCSDPNFIKPFKFIGRILSIVKIVIPIVIIIFGVIDLFQAVLGSKGDEINKSIKNLLFRAIAGIAIFFIPTLINLIFSLVDDWNRYSTDYQNCTKCLVNPNKC